MYQRSTGPDDDDDDDDDDDGDNDDEGDILCWKEKECTAVKLWGLWSYFAFANTIINAIGNTNWTNGGIAGVENC